MSPERSRTMSPGTRPAAARLDRLAGAADARRRCGRLAEGLERPLASILGDHVGADDRDECEQDQQAVADLAEDDRQDPGDDEEDDEGLGRGLDDEPPERGSLRGFELVGVVPDGPQRHFVGRQARFALDAERSGDIGGRQGMRIGERGRSPSRTSSRSSSTFGVGSVR